MATFPKDGRDMLWSEDWQLHSLIGENRRVVSWHNLQDLKEYLDDLIHRARYYREHTEALEQFERIREMIREMELSI